MNKRIGNIRSYFSFVKINHTVFSLPFALIGFSLAIRDKGDSLNLRLFLLVILSVLFARNAAMGFNRYADRDIDKRNPRTAFREIPRDIIRPSSALWFVVVNALLFMITTWFINLLCFILSPVALIVVCGYSLTKRFTWLSHLLLGLGLSLAPIGAYLAVTSRFAMLPLIYTLVVIFWVAGFDILYSLLDYEFDKSENLRSIPETFGKINALVISGLFHFLTVVLVVYAGFLGNFSYLYWTGTTIFCLILIYEHLIVTPGDTSKVTLAFAIMNGVASIVFAGFVIADMIIL